MKYVYPAVFTAETNGQLSVNFPDLEGCYTGGDNMADALEMAEDALCWYLHRKEMLGAPIPLPSHTAQISCQKNEIVQLVSCNTETYAGI